MNIFAAGIAVAIIEAVVQCVGIISDQRSDRVDRELKDKILKEYLDCPGKYQTLKIDELQLTRFDQEK